MENTDYFVAVDAGGNWCVFKNKWDNAELIDHYPSTDPDAERKAHQHCMWLNNDLDW